MWVQSLGQEDTLEKELAIHSSVLAWKKSIDREAWWVTVHGVAKSHTWLSDWHFHYGSLYSTPGQFLHLPYAANTILAFPENSDYCSKKEKHFPSSLSLFFFFIWTSDMKTTRPGRNLLFPVSWVVILTSGDSIFLLDRKIIKIENPGATGMEK